MEPNITPPEEIPKIFVINFFRHTFDYEDLIGGAGKNIYLEFIHIFPIAEDNLVPLLKNISKKYPLFLNELDVLNEYNPKIDERLRFLR